MLEIYAGANALKTIQQHGFNQALFTNMLGASGGPKWFTLFGLDKYLFGEYFKDRTSELNLIGSSAGAFRFAALSQKDPVAAISRLATHYSETVYSKNADAAEVTNKAKDLLDAVYGTTGVEEVLDNPIFKAHFIVAKCQGLTTFDQPILQMLGLCSSVVLNRINRGLIACQYQRSIFHHPNSQIRLHDNHQFNDQYISLTNNNLKDALLASGSIPMVMKAVKNIAGAPPGIYRDGGIIDYHFDIDIAPRNGLTLYPHFNASPKAGWFDKNLNRTVSAKHYENTVMLVPSQQFVDSLPFSKIPDRKDFTEMDATARIKYWRTVLAETERLAESFSQVIELQDISKIQLMNTQP